MSGQNDDKALTLEAVRLHGWRLVLLRPRDKRPEGITWSVTSDTERLRAHLERGGNIGLVCGPSGEASGVAVLDFDNAEVTNEMMCTLGRLPPTVRTGSGKGHVYVKWEDGLPAKIKWKDEVVGEVQRGGKGRLQHVVCPPSIHPSGGSYEWKLDPRIAPLELPEAWRVHLRAQSVGAAAADIPPGEIPALPSFVKRGDTRGTENAVAEWDGPPPEELLERARKQPGAKGRAGGSIKFQCAGCKAEGHDNSMDNARVFPTGRWGCALDRTHRRAIAVQLGVSPETLAVLPEDIRTLPADEWDERTLPFTDEDRAKRRVLSPTESELRELAAAEKRRKESRK